MRFTLDSNILVRAATSPRGPALRLLDIILGAHTLVLSRFILEEVERVLLYPRIQARYQITAVEAARFAENLADAADLVEPVIDRPVILSDPADDPILYTAVDGRAGILCTRNVRPFASAEVRSFCAATVPLATIDTPALRLSGGPELLRRPRDSRHDRPGGSAPPVGAGRICSLTCRMSAMGVIRPSGGFRIAEGHDCTSRPFCHSRTPGRIESVIRTRRQWLQAATMWPACLALRAAREKFWESRDPASWSNDEKQVLLGQSPWAREGFVRMDVEKDRRTTPGYGNNGRPAGGMPDTSPGVPPGGVQSVPIGEAPPPVPKPDSAGPLQFRVLARWETAKPVRLAGGPDVPELTGQFYVIRLRGLPLMPPPKAKPGEAVPNPNEGMLQAIKEGSRLARKNKRGIPCDHLFTGSGDAVTELLLFFPRGADPITVADKLVTLESRFAVFHMSIKFPLKDMMYKGELAL